MTIFEKGKDFLKGAVICSSKHYVNIRYNYQPINVSLQRMDKLENRDCNPCIIKITTKTHFKRVLCFLGGFKLSK